MTDPILKIDQSKWSEEAQAGELAFHKRPNFRSNDQTFNDGNSRLWRSFGFSPDQFAGKTLIDIGAGSRLRGKFFEGANLVAVEPLAAKFIEEVPWCDLSDATVYSEPAEKHIDELAGSGDLVFSINVLDHCYE